MDSDEWVAMSKRMLGGWRDGWLDDGRKDHDQEVYWKYTMTMGWATGGYVGWYVKGVEYIATNRENDSEG